MDDNNEIIIKRNIKGQLNLVESYNTNLVTHLVYEYGKKENTPKLSVGVLGYKNIEKTRICVESVLKYAQGIDYELVLIDNGSLDNNETIDFYKSVKYEKKIVLKVEEPIGSYYGSIYGTQLLYNYSHGDYIIFLGNDNIVTENSLQNMIKCLDSDVNIGVVTPMSSNVWMRQNPGITYSSLEEVYEKGRLFNVSDNRKWMERIQLTMVATMFKKEVAQRVGFFDLFADHTFSYRVRQAGYKLILLEDTWVCHDHSYSDENGKSNSQPWLGNSVNARKVNDFLEDLRYQYFDENKIFDDIMDFKIDLVDLIDASGLINKVPSLLSIDVKCGQGMLDLKNKMRQNDIFTTKSDAFTTNAKYYNWLKTVADRVYCDRIDGLDYVLNRNKYDCIILGEPINMYKEPIKLINSIMGALTEGGQFLFYLRNTLNMESFLKILGIIDSVDGEMPIHISIEDCIRCIKIMGYNDIKVEGNCKMYTKELIEKVSNIISQLKYSNINEENIINNLIINNYCICVKK